MGNENKLWSGHPSYWGYLVFYIFGVSAIILGSLHVTYLVWVIGLGVFLLILPILDRLSKVYVITSDKIRAQANIFRYVNEILIKDITSIDLQSHGVERVFGLGTIKFTAGVGEEITNQIEFKGVPNPQTVIEKIEELRRKHGNHQDMLNEVK